MFDMVTTNTSIKASIKDAFSEHVRAYERHKRNQFFSEHINLYKKHIIDTQRQKYVKTAEGKHQLPESRSRVIQCVLDVDDELRIHGGRLPLHFGDLDAQIKKIRDKGQKPYIVMTSDAMLNGDNPQTYAAMSNGGNHKRYIVGKDELHKRGLSNAEIVYLGAKVRRSEIREPYIQKVVSRRGFLPFGG